MTTHADRYLEAVRADVPAWSFRRSSMLREIRDGLDDATAAHLDGGLDRSKAEAAAIAEFGPPAEVAAAIRADLAVAAGRTAAVTLGAISALQMVVAGLIWRSEGATHGFPALSDGYTTLAVSIDVFALVVLVAGFVTWAVLGTAHRRTRRWDRVAITRGVGMAVLAAVVLQGAAGLTLAALGPGLDATVSSAADMAFAVGPSVVLVALAVRCLRLASRRGRSGGQNGPHDPAERLPLPTT